MTNEELSKEAELLAAKAREIHELQYHMDVEELRARLDDLAVIVDRLAQLVGLVVASGTPARRRR